MDRILEWLLAYGAGTTLVVLVVWALFKFVWLPYAERQLDSHFEERLEDHKHKLTLAAEAIRHNYERQLEGYGHFVQQKHASYGEAYLKLRIADGHVQGLTGLSEAPDFSHWNEEDTRAYFKKRNVSDTLIDETFKGKAASGLDRAAAAQSLLGRVEFHEAKRAITEANNHFLAREIYFSPDLSKRVRQIVRDLQESLRLVDCRREGRRMTDAQIDKEVERASHLYKQVPKDLDEICRIMRQELSEDVTERRKSS